MRAGRLAAGVLTGLARRRGGVALVAPDQLAAMLAAWHVECDSDHVALPASDAQSSQNQKRLARFDVIYYCAVFYSAHKKPARIRHFWCHAVLLSIISAYR